MSLYNAAMAALRPRGGKPLAEDYEIEAIVRWVGEFNNGSIDRPEVERRVQELCVTKREDAKQAILLFVTDALDDGMGE